MVYLHACTCITVIAGYSSEAVATLATESARAQSQGGDARLAALGHPTSQRIAPAMIIESFSRNRLGEHQGRLTFE